MVFERDIASQRRDNVSVADFADSRKGGCWNEIVTRVLGESFILTMGTASVIEVRAGRGRSSHLMVDRGNARLFEREARTTFRLR
jgi:hypothetical protein